jgi:poly-gamma-glutamate synthesis protein (capsule biosynthesis protein)
MRRVAAGLVVAIVLVACSAQQIPTAEVTRDGSAAARPAGPPVPRAGARPRIAPRLGSGKPITIAFGGDVNFEANVRSVLDQDPADVFAGVRSALEADLTMVNLETAITERGTPEPKTYTFRAPATAFAALRSAGVDVVTIGNNHGMDFGPVGLEDTLSAADDLAHGLPLVGGGHDVQDAYLPFRVTIRGQRIAVFGASRVVDGHLLDSWTATEDRAGLAVAYDPTLLVEALRAERRHADTVIVYLHWGHEYVDCPPSDQTDLADTLIAAGADIVVGSHAHVPLGAGMKGGAYVSYGLGNFVFGSADGPSTESGVLRLTVTGRRVDAAEWAPAHISGGIPSLLEGDAAASAEASWEGLRDCTDLQPGVERTVSG